jgi:hypothetical protein
MSTSTQITPRWHPQTAPQTATQTAPRQLQDSSLNPHLLKPHVTFLQIGTNYSTWASPRASSNPRKEVDESEKEHVSLEQRFNLLMGACDAGRRAHTVDGAAMGRFQEEQSNRVNVALRNRNVEDCLERQKKEEAEEDEPPQQPRRQPPERRADSP